MTQAGSLRQFWFSVLFALFLPVCARAQVTGLLKINPISDAQVQLGSNLVVTVSVTNSVPVNSLLWSIASGPSGVFITNSTPANTALLTWQPSIAQAPSTNDIQILVQDISNLANQAFTSFRVFVFTNAVDSPPELAPIDDQTAVPGQLLSITNSAQTTDGTSNALIFSLDSDAPSGASINPITGVFTWTPTADQVDTFAISIIVTEPATSLSDTQVFTVNVIVTNNCAGLDDFLAAVAAGGIVDLTNCPTLVLSNTLTIANEVTLDAGTNTVVITGNKLVRLFTVLSTGSLTLNGVTLSGGQSTNGGAIFVEEGGTVTISNCVFQSNSAIGSNGVAGVDGADKPSSIGGNGGPGTVGDSAYGGAIYNAGNLTVLYSSFFTNSAEGGDGGNGGNGGDGPYQGGNGGKAGNGGSASGGAIYNIGTVLIDSCTFDGNTLSAGNGGTGGSPGTGTFAGLTGAGGTAGAASGAGVHNKVDAIVINSTFSGNQAAGGNSAAGGSDNIGNNGARGGEGSGGGVYNFGTVEVTNCTFYANVAIGGAGGNGGTGNYGGGNGGNGGNGLGAGLYSSAGGVQVINCTFAQNQARGGTNGLGGGGLFQGSKGSLGAAHGAGVARAAGTFYLQNSILFTNAPGTNAYGTITDGGANISSDSSLAGTSKKKTNPRIGSLADNGGPTKTMALLTNSPAIDAADDSAAPDVDQRGVERPIGPHSDIGAFEASTIAIIEVQPQSQTQTNGGPVTFRVSALGDTLSYQWRFYGTNTTATKITGATSSAYTIPAVGPANVGGYDVIVSNPFGSVTSQVATLSIGLAPVITLSPTNQTVALGSNVTFFSSATGDPPLAFQWRFNATNIAGATSSAFTLANVQPANGGSYTVTVSNRSGVVTSGEAILIVDTAERFTISGHVLQNGIGISGVTVTADTNSALTDAQGAYTVTGVHAGDYFVFASKTGLEFGASQPVTVGPDATNINFSPIQPLYNISGRVLSGGVGLSGVQIFGGRTTDSNGVFQFSFPAGTTVLVPSKPGYSFVPASRTVVLPPDATNQDFIAGSVVSIVARTNGNVVISVSGSGRTRIEASSNLVNWISIYTNTAPFSFTNTTQSAVSVFYRSVQP